MPKSLLDICQDIFKQAKTLAPHSPDSFRNQDERFNATGFDRLMRHATTNPKTKLHYVAMLQSRPSTLPADKAHVFSDAALNWHLDASSPRKSLLDEDISFRRIRLPGSPVAPFQQFQPAGIQRLKDIIAAEANISAKLKQKLNTLTPKNAWYFTLTEKEARQLKSYLGLHSNEEYRMLGSMINKHLTIHSLTRLLRRQSIDHSKTLQNNLYQPSEDEHAELIVEEAKASARFGIGSHFELAAILSTLLMQSTELPEGTLFEINIGIHEDPLHHNDPLNYQKYHHFVSITDGEGNKLIMDPWSNTIGYDRNLKYMESFNRGVKSIFRGSTGSRPLTEAERLTPREPGEERIPFSGSYDINLVHHLQANLHTRDRDFNDTLNSNIRAHQEEFDKGVKALSLPQAASLLMDLVDTGPRSKHAFRLHHVLGLRPDLQQLLADKGIKIPPTELETIRGIRIPASKGDTQNVSLNTIHPSDYRTLQENIFTVLKPIMSRGQAAVRVTSVSQTTFGGARAGSDAGKKQEVSTNAAP